jgi:hypothetical protein
MIGRFNGPRLSPACRTRTNRKGKDSTPDPDAGRAQYSFAVGGLDEGLVSRDRTAIPEKIETAQKIRKWFRDLVMISA